MKKYRLQKNDPRYFLRFTNGENKTIIETTYIPKAQQIVTFDNNTYIAALEEVVEVGLPGVIGGICVYRDFYPYSGPQD
jgi:hypothetical protein